MRKLALNSIYLDSHSPPGESEGTVRVKTEDEVLREAAELEQRWSVMNRRSRRAAESKAKKILRNAKKTR